VLWLRFLRGARRGLLGVACALLVTPAAAGYAESSVLEPGGGGAAAPTPSPRHGTGSLLPADLSRQIQLAEQQLEVVVEEYDAIQVRLAGTQRQSTAVATALVPLRQAVADLQHGVGQLTTNLYIFRPARLAALLSAGSPRAALDQVAMAEHLARQERHQVHDLRATQAGYAARQRDLATLASQQAGQQAALAVRRAAILARIATLKKLRTHAGTTWHRPRPLPATPAPGYASDAAGRAVQFALAQIGRPYAWGRSGPGSYDCSGLVMAAWRLAGVTLPHNAAMQWRVVAHISRAEARPGDLVFFYRDIHHVGMYLGDGRMVHAPTYGLDVMIARIDEGPIYGFGRPS
jgi:cell wall-associated NlpC family hydrolase